MRKKGILLTKLFDDGHLIWLFIMPSMIMLALFALPLFALFVRSLKTGFFAYAFSEQALSALKLSLITST